MAGNEADGVGPAADNHSLSATQANGTAKVASFKGKAPEDAGHCAASGTAHAPAPPAAGVPDSLARGLRRSPKYLPCSFLYDDRGSQLYEQITCLPSYYPYRAEQALLRQHARAIAAHVPPGSVVVELGCGDSTKTAILLRELLHRQGNGNINRQGSNNSNVYDDGGGSGRGSDGCDSPVHFCGVDCSAEALRQTQRNLRRLLPELPEGQVELVESEYLGGVAAVRERHPDALLSILWLGSSVGNFSSGEAAEFLRELRSVAGEQSQLLLCTDTWKDEGVLREAYNEDQGVSEAFIVNGMHHALSTLGHPDAYSENLWRYEVVVNENLKQVEMYVEAQRRVADVLPGLHIEAGERILVEISRKFTPQAIASMAFSAGLCPCATWSNPSYSIQLLLTPELALQRCWQDTDSLFTHILDWEAQPIGLRHPFCFYYGHVAAFGKLKLLPEEPTAELDEMLSRGIDPSVLEPQQCHSHPAVPPSWPSRPKLQSYVANVRQQLLAAVRQLVGLKSGVSMHALCMVLEHERMHQETLCYMLAQQRKMDAAAAAKGKPPALLPASFPAAPAGSRGLGGTISLADDSSSGGLLSCTPGAAGVAPFYLDHCRYLSAALVAPSACSEIQSAAPFTGSIGGTASPQHSQLLEPITPAKAAERSNQPAAMRLSPYYNMGSGTGNVTASVDDNSMAGGTAASTADGSFLCIPAGQVTLGVPSTEEHGFLWDCEMGRLGPLTVPSLLLAASPVTVAQFHRFIVEEKGYQREELWDAEAYSYLRASGQTMPATWSYASAARPAAADSSEPPAGGEAGERQLMVHMPEGSYCWERVANCPVYVSLAEAQAFCRLHNARLLTEAEWEHAAHSEAAASGALQQLEEGGWEWTSSVFEPLPGFQADPLYPEFSTDFHDGQHYVLRGSSPYTHPSLARHVFRNFYQPLYPYLFGKFRMVRAMEQ